MLKSTFCHIPGISESAEQHLWSSGIQCWEEAARAGTIRLPRKKIGPIARHIEQSFESLEKNDPHYFAALLPANQHWRFFPDFQQSVAYLDIETTGLGYSDSITTIVVYDGRSTSHYVQNQNLYDFTKDIARYNVLVTYNGKCFDVPFIERYFGIRLDQAHIDLRYVLKSLGYSGGLKGCERQMGIDRKDLSDVDGYIAVLLWDDFKKNRNQKALETLLAYNTQDVVNLETLMVMAYNLKLEQTPFRLSHRLRLPAPPPSAFHADRETINRIQRKISWSAFASRF